MNTEVEQIYQDLFFDLALNTHINPMEQLSFFCAMRGLKSKGELMVFGRAVNGWEAGHAASELVSEAQRKKVIAEMNDYSEPPDKCPMRWVTDAQGAKEYNTNKSAFWRVIRMTTADLSIANCQSPNWSSYLIWSNLYKVSPKEKGNPSSRLKRIQLEYCKKLLAEELSHFSPKRLLFLAGMDWIEPFIENELISFKLKPHGSYAELYGRVFVHSSGQSIPAVVAKHPQGKPERELVDEIISAFSAIGTDI